MHHRILLRRARVRTWIYLFLVHFVVSNCIIHMNMEWDLQLSYNHEKCKLMYQCYWGMGKVLNQCPRIALMRIKVIKKIEWYSLICQLYFKVHFSTLIYEYKGPNINSSIFYKAHVDSIAPTQKGKPLDWKTKP